MGFSGRILPVHSFFRFQSMDFTDSPPPIGVSLCRLQAIYSLLRVLWGKSGNSPVEQSQLAPSIKKSPPSFQDDSSELPRTYEIGLPYSILVRVQLFFMGAWGGGKVALFQTNDIKTTGEPELLVHYKDSPVRKQTGPRVSKPMVLKHASSHPTCRGGKV